MNINEIKEKWKRQEGNKNAGIHMWNSVADKFGDFILPTAQNSMTIRIIEQHKMVEKNTSVLDVGCGAGKYSIALAKRGAIVTGTDFSPKMIEITNKQWDNSFDLVLANMTPAIQDAESFEKLIYTCRGWGVLVKPCKRTNSVSDVLELMLKLNKTGEGIDDSMAFAFHMIWNMGLDPYMEYEEQKWQTIKPLDEAVQYYTDRMESRFKLSSNQKHEIKEYLESIALNGMIEEETNTTVTAMYWRI